MRGQPIDRYGGGPPGHAQSRRLRISWRSPIRRTGFGWSLGILAFALIGGVVAVGPTSAVVLPPKAPFGESPSLFGLGASGAPSAPKPVGPAGIVNLSVGAEPDAICEGDLAQCPAEASESELTLAANAGVRGQNAWPAVQVLFVLETTAYDGVYDPSVEVPGSDPCGIAELGTGPLCFESNGVPFFVTNAGEIAIALQAEYPSSALSFGLVDYFATHDLWDSGGGTTYHVDLGRFANATQFGREVQETFQRTMLGGGFVLPNSDLNENILDSDSITAVYGALAGAGGLNWSNASHHVLVQVGTTAPRDPNYPENYCVSPAVTPHGLSNCIAPGCEPSTSLGPYQTPNCEGWTVPPSGNQTDSIAAFAHLAAPCVDSFGANCTIDEINLNATPTDPTSLSWSAAGGSGGPANWTQDAANILNAGCDMASATGGSWAGPTWYKCVALGAQGTLAYVPLGSVDEPQTDNPTLLKAFERISLGAVPDPLIALGASQPMFQFLPWGNFTIAPIPNWAVVCKNATGINEGCPNNPDQFLISGVTAFGWNWSDTPNLNLMTLGESWQVSFDVVATGPPYGLLPVDACTTVACRLAGSGAIASQFTSMTFREYGGANLEILSFPLVQVALEALTGPSNPQPLGPPILPPGAPTTGPPPPSSNVLPPAPAAAVPASAISVEAAAAGFIAAGMISVGVRASPQANKQGSLYGPNATLKKRKPTQRTPLSRWA